ncbi:hypothetical protein BJ742DRAFT_845899 [Cladochytrium replicatum]|nr:hypothetical protein BJ742DRAFT_845899 [Cladochytrium replicatum]
MVDLDPEVVLLCVVAACVAAGATVALVAVLVWRIRQLRWPMTHPFRSWTRFQTLTICTCIAGIAFYSISIVELVQVMYISPENLTKSGAAVPGVWNNGAPKFLVSLAETASQILLALTVYCYFLILMERLVAFRFLLSARTFRLLYTPLFIFGTLLFILMLVSTVLINMTVATLTESEITILVISSSSLMFGTIVFEFALSVTLCKTFFIKSTRQRQQESWNLSRRANHQNFVHSENQNKSYPTPTPPSLPYPPPGLVIHPQSSIASDLPNTIRSFSHHSTSLIVSPSAVTQNSRSDAASAYSLGTVLRDTYKRRTVLLFCGILLADVMGIVFYFLSLEPEAQAMARPIEVMGRCSVGFHMMLALIFLDSFRQILHPEYTDFALSTRAP